VQNGPVLFADLIGVTRMVARARKRSEQVDVLAQMIEHADGEVVLTVGWITGELGRELRGVSATALPAISPKPGTSATLEVGDVDRALRAVAADESLGELDEVARTWRELGERMTLPEWDFLRETLAEQFEARASEAVVISAIAKSARVRVGEVRRAAAILGSVSEAAAIAVRTGSEGLNAVDIQPGRPVPPMRAMTAVDVVDGVTGMDRFAMEWSLAGTRIQAHRVAGAVTLFGDDLVDVTAAHPEAADVVRDLPDGDLVLDGVIDDKTVRFFDVLFDGNPVADEPLRRRRERLEAMLPEAHLVPVVEVTSRGDVDAWFEVAVAGSPDGIVVKDVSAPYEPGHRGRSWRRVSRSHTFDLVVIGAEWGTGGRQGLLSTVHLGARRADGGFELVGKTARGLTDEMIEWQTERLTSLALDPVPDQAKGVLRVRPELVAQVSARGVEGSDRFGGVVALDSVRIRHYREDVAADAATSLEQLVAVIGEPPAVETTRTGPDDEARAASPAPPVPTLPAPAPRLPTAVDEPSRDGRTNEPITATPLLGAAHPRNAALNIDFDFPPYEPPMLDRSAVPLRAVLAARFAALAWVLAMAVAAVAARWSADGGAVDGETVTVLGQFVVAVAAAIVLTGWWWSDQRTRNLHRLDGRRPGRVRCVTAWIAPLVGVSFLVFAIVPLEPTELLDLRPIVITLVFPIVLWRPYSLARRIFATLIRLRFDALIVVAFLFDVVSFGLIWWWLSVWPSADESALAGEIDVMVGIGFAVSLTMAISALVWFLLLRAGVAAEGHREASQRTRYEHRMLRLRGADPTEPAVWWALVQRRADEQREIEQSTGTDGVGTSLATVGAPTVEALLENVRQRNGHALRRLGVDDSNELLGRLRTQFANVIGEPSMRRPAPASGVVAEPEQAEREQLRKGQRSDEPPSSERVPEPAQGGVVAPPKSERFSRIRQSLSVDPELAAMVEATPMEHLLDYAGAVQVEAAVAEQNRRLAEAAPEERMLPPTLYRLEAVRFLLLLSLGAATVAALWLVNRTLTAGSATIASASEKASDIDEARRVLMIALSASLVLIPLWTWVAAIYARRCDATERRHGPALALFIVSAGVSTASALIDGDERGLDSFLLLIVIVACASAAGLSLLQARAWFGLRSVSVVVWAAVLPLTLAVLWFGGLAEPTERVDSLQSMTLAAVLTALACGLVVVLVSLSTEDFEDEVKLSPELAVPASARRRRRRRRRW
jgi:DNA ligase-1